MESGDGTSEKISRRYEMRFGALPLSNGKTRFNLWAPRAQSVHLILPHDDPDVRPLPPLTLNRQKDGWYSLETFAPAGTRYRYLINGTDSVPDPASRHQPESVHGDSQVIDPASFPWQDGHWRGRPWHEAIIYEVHVGTFSPEGTFDGVTQKLDALAQLGITALELMPLADFPGRFGWGYDGVAMFAPCARYGHPDALKNLVQQAHARGMMVLLDVVYNHFGPEGNYLHGYAPAFFHRHRHTPWGNALNFDGRQSGWVRRFFIDNALYWLEEFHFDGLRLDAVQAISDHSATHFMDELNAQVAAGPGQGRHIHLVLEHGDNATRFLTPGTDGHYSGGRAQWNDDFHHSAHVLATCENQGYYGDFHSDPITHLSRCLEEGFSFQGEFSHYYRKKRGNPSAHLPPECFVNFLQNHDQTGNRPQGERLHALAHPEIMRALTVLFMLAPHPPMLFMGQEWGSLKPFYFFSDLEPRLQPSIITGRRREFIHFFNLTPTQPPPPFPDPTRSETFMASKLDWDEACKPSHQEWLDLHKYLIKIRKKEIWPRVRQGLGRPTRKSRDSTGSFHVFWSFQTGETLTLMAHLSATPQYLEPPKGRCLFATAEKSLHPQAWYAGWFINDTHSNSSLPTTP
ncbi:MAG: malto-oligosyltrehalose trehalohydrolase [Magnetococcales bacterium]|nr:malto-oligosyltrehalose trehalohydrolase [Magnetococcales bacterium]